MHFSVCPVQGMKMGDGHISELDGFSVAAAVLLVAKCCCYLSSSGVCLKYEDIILWVCHKHRPQMPYALYLQHL